MLDYARALLVHVSQTAACGAAHRVPQRLARWLLQTSERTGVTEIELTQDFLSQVLGVRRASITAAVRELAAGAGVLARRGAIVIDDRAALERAACECYGVVRDAYARLLP